MQNYIQIPTVRNLQICKVVSTESLKKETAASSDMLAIVAVVTQFETQSFNSKYKYKHYLYIYVYVVQWNTVSLEWLSNILTGFETFEKNVIVNIKVSICLITHHAAKDYEGLEVHE